MPWQNTDCLSHIGGCLSIDFHMDSEDGDDVGILMPRFILCNLTMAKKNRYTYAFFLAINLHFWLVVWNIFYFPIYSE